ncbi:hemimethylated DNA-binding domain protein [Ceratobasidium sp. AG-Ba]|nr:hemimethylated DNA-binding domain protein [Ceratobasidium sp. AG-Ba]
MSVLSVPEVTLAILACLPASKYDDTSVRTLIACTKVARTLRDIVKTGALLWPKHYYARWTTPILANLEGDECYQRYCWRRNTDLQVLSLLETIITTPSQRATAMMDIYKIRQFAWDTLRTEATCKVPGPVRDVWQKKEEQWVRERWEGAGEEWMDGSGGKDFGEGDEREVDTRDIKPDWMQRRCWAKHALRSITRADAWDSMLKLYYPYGVEPKLTSLENGRDFEAGLIALSGLMGENTSEISHNYDNLAKACRDALVQVGVCIDPANDNFDLKKFSSGVFEWMINQGFRKIEYHHDACRLTSYFPHTFRTTHRRAVPMSLVCTFVAIVTRLGFPAAPIRFQRHVLAWIALPSYLEPDPDVDEAEWEDEQPTHRLIMDVSFSEDEPLMSSENIRRKMRDSGVPDREWKSLMTPSSAAAMVSQSIVDLREPIAVGGVWCRPTHDPIEYYMTAHYVVTLMALITRPPTADTADILQAIVELSKFQTHYLLDIETVLNKSLDFFSSEGPSPAPELALHLQHTVTQLRDTRVDVKRRKTEKYWVGMMFKHAKSDYLGVIFGWDAAYNDQARWVPRDSDTPPRGRNQPFYSTLASDGSGRYVAEEDVIQLPHSRNTLSEAQQRITWDNIRELMMAWTSYIGRMFSRVEVDEESGRAWFVPGKSTAREYPDDTALGEEYMRKL